MMNILRIMKTIGMCLACAAFAGCTYTTQGFPDEDRGALPNANDNFGDKTTRIVYPDQNWDASDSLWFYNTSQGSDLMDYEIFLNLTLANSDLLFRSNENMGKYRYLLQQATFDNGEALPVGWVKDSYDGNDYIGFTCATCHTTQVNHNGTGIRIDGGPAMTDVWTMFEDLEQALKASLPEKEFSKLADRILKGNSSDTEKRKNLKNRLDRDYRKIRDYNQEDQPPTIKQNGVEVPSVHYGYARLDAFGRIFNRAASHFDSTHTGNPANAPVSYPHLWDTPQHDFVQWNGIADNGALLGIGPLGRNSGEVVGVFASVKVQKKEPSFFWKLFGFKKSTYSYPSSVRTLNQVRLEDHIQDLWSPSWDQLTQEGALPEIDKTLVERGRKVFDLYKCGACHSHIDRDDKDRLVIAQFTSVNLIETDTTMASNALTYCSKNDALPDVDHDTCTVEPNNQPGLTGKSAMTAITQGALLEGVFGKILPFLQTMYSNPWRGKKTERHIDFEVVKEKNSSPEIFLNAYKGRPLNGIWATAPFLHNGSVPNLYELFLPSSCEKEDGTTLKPGETCRSKTFTVGNRELDIQRVGFVQADDPTKRDPGLFVFDTSLKGNSNKGHEYAVGVTPIIKRDVDGKAVRKQNGEFDLEFLTPAIEHNDRMALIEYLKTL